MKGHLREEAGTAEAAVTDREPARLDSVVGLLAQRERAAAASGEAVSDVRIVETHAAIVVLAGTHAYKMKRPVAFSYLDFSTLERRHTALARELEINRATTPDIYLRLDAIVRQTDGTLAIVAEREVVEADEIVEWVLVMRRFAERDVLAEMAGRDAIDLSLTKALADTLADLHRAAPVRSAALWPAPLTSALDGLERGAAAAGTAAVREAATEVAAKARRRLVGLTPHFAGRLADGHVRRCHGDLHLGNIVLWQGRPAPFDALEFDENLATIDIQYDLAFLLMDLWHRGMPDRANALLGRWLWRMPETELDGLAALPVFMAIRAGIRAMVALDRARVRRSLSGEASEAGDDMVTAVGYLATTAHCLEDREPRLVGVGGLSGTGKSTLAARLAPVLGAVPGALHFRSDLERKRLFAVEETERLPPVAYTTETTERVYATLLAKARRSLAAGASVIVDAVHARPAERAAIEAVAREAGVAFTGLWLEAPAALLGRRVEARTGDASDADATVVARQLGYEVGPLDWQRIDTSGSLESSLVAAYDAIGRPAASAPRKPMAGRRRKPGAGMGRKPGKGGS